MTACNQCGGVMVPDSSALVPALACGSCGRLIPRTAVRPIRVKDRADERRQVNKALRASRRQQLATERHPIRGVPEGL